MRTWMCRALTTTGVAVTTIVLLATPSYAAPAPDYEMPFGCGQDWTGTTRAKHSPSVNAVDFNRPDDTGQFVVASAPGVVTRVEDLGNRSYGRYVVVDHGNGDSTLYAHLLSQWVSAGQRVDQGAILGKVGGTGNVTGPHLHFEERADSRVQPPWFHGVRYPMGTTQDSRNCPDVPLAGDWDGDGGDEVAVFRRGVNARFRQARDGARPQVVRFGWGSDQPLTGDWDGDGTTDVGVRRPGWRKFLLRARDGSTVQVRLGRVRDVGVTGDWDGNGSTDVGVWNPSSARFTLRSGTGAKTRIVLGNADDQPVTGDWNGDGATDVGVFDAGTRTFTLRSEPGDGSVTVTTLPFGSTTDIPVTGDWDGNGVTDVGTWSPATATYALRVTPVRARGTAPITTLRFGRAR